VDFFIVSIAMPDFSDIDVSEAFEQTGYNNHSLECYRQFPLIRSRFHSVVNSPTKKAAAANTSLVFFQYL